MLSVFDFLLKVYTIKGKGSVVTLRTLLFVFASFLVCCADCEYGSSCYLLLLVNKTSALDHYIKLHEMPNIIITWLWLLLPKFNSKLSSCVVCHCLGC